MMDQERVDWDSLLESALRCGIGVREFWALTPRETLATVEACGWRQEQARRRDAWLAWHVAALVRTRRMPGLRALLQPRRARALEGEELERRRAERDEMLERVDVAALNEAMRGRRKT